MDNSATDDKLKLPCQPRVVALLMNELRTDAPSLRRLVQLFGADPVLAGWLLGQANAGIYQLVGQVRGIPQAVALLGVSQLRILLKKAYASLSVRVAGMDQFGPYSLASARLARSLAAICSLETSQAYAAGLLHALGQLVQHQTNPAQAAQLSQQVPVWDPRRPALEVQQLGYSTHQTTVALLRSWGLPTTLCQLIRDMEQPLKAKDLEPLSVVLHLSVWAQRARFSRWSEREQVRAFPVEEALAVGLDMDVVLQQETPDWSRSIY